MEQGVGEVAGWHSVVAVDDGKLGRVLKRMLKKKPKVRFHFTSYGSAKVLKRMLKRYDNKLTIKPAAVVEIVSELLVQSCLL